VSDQRLRDAERRARQDTSALAVLEAERARFGLTARLPAFNGDADDVWKYAQGFTRDDVAETLASQIGENDGREWVAVVRLFDGRVAAVRAGCDYTGWG
jgi:hypothetical protein